MTVQLKTIKASGGDYTTLQAFEDAAAVSSTNADPWHAECYSGVNMGGFTKGAWSEEPSAESERVKIYAAPGHEHDGSWSHLVGAYSSISSGWSINSYGQNLDFFIIEGLLFLNSKNSTGIVLISGGGGGNKLELKRLWCYKSHVTPTSANMYIQTNSSSDASDVLIENCIIRRGTDGLYISTLSGSPAFVGTIRNCVFHGCSDRGIQTGFTASVNNTLTLQNTICGENSTADLYINAVDTLVIDNNISTDATADDYGGTGNQIDVDAADIWNDPANGDYTLKIDSPARNAGTTIADVADDIIETTRPQGKQYDVGAYELLETDAGQRATYSASGPSAWKATDVPRYRGGRR